MDRGVKVETEKKCEVESCDNPATTSITYRPGRNILGRVSPDYSKPETRMAVCTTHDWILTMDMWGTE